MIVRTAQRYWKICRTLRAGGLSPRHQELFLNGDALLELKAEEDPKFKALLADLIATECEKRGLKDRTRFFMK